MPEIAVNGIQLSYEITGQGPPALLICGTGQPASMWDDPLLEMLKGAGCSVVRFDNRGMPPSDCPPPPWTVTDMATDAIGLIEQLELEPCHVIGASLGALITQTVALARPDLVRSATLMVGGGNYCRSAALGQRGQVDLLATGVEVPAAMQRRNLLEAILTPPQLQNDDMVDLALGFAGDLVSSFGPGGQYGQVHADAVWAEEDHVPELAGMRPPCLVIAAEHDPYFPPAHLREAAATIPDSEYVEIAGAAHVIIDPSMAAQLRSAISKFVQAH